MSDGLVYRDAKAVDISLTDADVGGSSAIYVGGAGDLVLIMRGGSPGSPFVGAGVLFKVIAGQTLRVHAATVVKTGTTATSLVSLY